MEPASSFFMLGAMVENTPSSFLAEGRYVGALRSLNVARAVAVTTLLLASFIIEILFTPERPLTPLYWLSGAVYGTVLVYALLERWVGDKPYVAVIQLGSDIVIIAAFVVATGGSLSPVSFLFAVPVMIGAALFGLRGGVLSAAASWTVYALVLVLDSWNAILTQGDAGRALYAATSHLVGFIALGALGGVLADRLRTASQELQTKSASLELLRALHAQIVESINTGILTTDPQGRITYVNRAGFAILDMSPDELQGRRVTQLFGFAPDLLQQAEREVALGRRSRFERGWKRPSDGEDVFLGFALSALREGESGGGGWLLVFQDLTEIASLEQQVRTRERMAALGEMAAGIAHELRNPLAAISGCVQVLHQASDQPEHVELVGVTLREAERLNRIIKDFLEFARPSPFQPRAYDIGPSIDEMVRILRKSPEVGPDHRVLYETPDPQIHVMADPDRVRQVFWNLANNALKAMPGGGTLTIQVLPYAGDKVMIAFRDDGQGMDEETVRRYFQPFSGRFEEGAGLGAAIVYRIAEEHGGDVQVVSREGRGSEVRFILPRANDPGGGAEPLASEARGSI